MPHHRTDALLRKVNLDRYDDRDDIRANLLESYERLMQFINKHLNDTFYLEGDRRISLRDKLFREVVSNLLIHREFANPFPTKLIIEKDRVVTENSNKPHSTGIIDPDNFSSFPRIPQLPGSLKKSVWWMNWDLVSETPINTVKSIPAPSPFLRRGMCSERLYR